ncbi:VOC family protein [Actinomadura sp. HBU206391]|uniref:VOC family protein n=1 Tax=Actinomadura sp. HBU206391 TaxID=2731692 RepID=UPI0016501758|nr:VOC family protein [Actinomadura sp. HBU206391]MBC6463736.1 VOC family protein [Actinomadura sp. HBU206391]
MPVIDDSLDHLVYAGPDLDEAARHVEALTGVRPVEGGRHPGLGTRNRLLGLGGRRYLEIVGPDPDQPAPDRPRPFGLDGLTGPRLVTWAIRAADIEDRVMRSRALGYDPGDAESMSRRTGGGELLRWRLTAIRDGPVPFLIDWGTTVHPADRGLPVVPLVSFTAAHPEPGAVRLCLDLLGADLDVRRAERPALTAVLVGTSGSVTLG